MPLLSDLPERQRFLLLEIGYDELSNRAIIIGCSE